MKRARDYLTGLIQCTSSPDDSVELYAPHGGRYAYLEVVIEDYAPTNSQIELSKATAAQLGQALLDWAQS